MSAPEQSNDSWQQRVINDLKRDKKKTGILAVLFIVGVVVGLRFLLKGKPDSAAGGTAAIVSADVVDMDNAVGPKTGRAVRPKRASTPRKPRPEMPDVKITRDLFELHPETYHLIRAAKVGLPNPAGGMTLADGATKELTPEQLAAAKVQDEAKILCLEMTIVSDTPSAFINGTLLRKGDTFVVLVQGRAVVSINGKKRVGVPVPANAKESQRLVFKVAEVSSDACVVVKDDVRVTLKMPTDGLK